MRGEDDRIFLRTPGSCGSPPHAWGRLHGITIRTSTARFTPTCVGKTYCRSPFSDRPTGSPPHAWGRPIILFFLSMGHRFTPTCVGKTCHRHRRLPVTSVHPHMRGEDALSDAFLLHVIGSPPHAWGRLLPYSISCFIFRFTPTCVGKTPIRKIIVLTNTVHPHMRGEDARSQQLNHSRYGSPPHAWGRPKNIIIFQPPYRFTPTCVGKTSSV